MKRGTGNHRGLCWGGGLFSRVAANFGVADG